jgi:hypothetical protein
MDDNNLTSDCGQYGYVATPAQRPRIPHSSQARASLRREVIDKLGRLKSERLFLHRTITELEVQMESLRIEASEIGTLVFGDLEEERAALVAVHNFMHDLREYKMERLGSSVDEISQLKQLWTTYLSSIPR